MDNIKMMQELMNRLNTLNTDSTEVSKKELEDYLREKDGCGLIKNGRITFKDTDDKEYFEKLANKCGLNTSDLLCRLCLITTEE